MAFQLGCASLFVLPRKTMPDYVWGMIRNSYGGRLADVLEVKM
jgi:hypothetical protein